jgi:DNA-binding HxlR family transcriptional regulator
MMTSPAFPVESALKVISGKWKVLIVWHLSGCPQRYAMLRRLIPHVTEKVLIRQLRELEADGIIKRTDFQTLPLHVEYELSEEGKKLLPVLGMLCQWGKLHLHADPG